MWQSDPVIPAFPDLHLSPAAILKELSMYFQKFSAQTRLLTLPAPHEIPPREAQEYPVQNCFFINLLCSFFVWPIFWSFHMTQLLLRGDILCIWHCFDDYHFKHVRWDKIFWQAKKWCVGSFFAANLSIKGWNALRTIYCPAFWLLQIFLCT